MRFDFRSIVLVLMCGVASLAHAGFVMEGDPAIAPSKDAKSASPVAAAAQLEALPAKPVEKPKPIAPLPSWIVKVSDVTLRQSLLRWAKDAGWQVSWEVKIDYPVQLEATFYGTFENAVENYMSSLAGSDHPLLACMYDGNRVVRVMRYGDHQGCDK